MPEIDFWTQKSIENQLEWLQFSKIIVGPNKKQATGWCTVVKTDARKKTKVLKMSYTDSHFGCSQ